jgi:hypothetical protein
MLLRAGHDRNAFCRDFEILSDLAVRLCGCRSAIPVDAKFGHPLLL